MFRTLPGPGEFSGLAPPLHFTPGIWFVLQLHYCHVNVTWVPPPLSLSLSVCHAWFLSRSTLSEL